MSDVNFFVSIFVNITNKIALIIFSLVENLLLDIFHLFCLLIPDRSLDLPALGTFIKNIQLLCLNQRLHNLRGHVASFVQVVEQLLRVDALVFPEVTGQFLAFLLELQHLVQGQHQFRGFLFPGFEAHCYFHFLRQDSIV